MLRGGRLSHRERRQRSSLFLGGWLLFMLTPVVAALFLQPATLPNRLFLLAIGLALALPALTLIRNGLLAEYGHTTEIDVGNGVLRVRHRLGVLSRTRSRSLAAARRLVLDEGRAGAMPVLTLVTTGTFLVLGEGHSFSQLRTLGKQLRDQCQLPLVILDASAGTVMLAPRSERPAGGPEEPHPGPSHSTSPFGHDTDSKNVGDRLVLTFPALGWSGMGNGWIVFAIFCHLVATFGTLGIWTKVATGKATPETFAFLGLMGIPWVLVVWLWRQTLRVAWTRTTLSVDGRWLRLEQTLLLPRRQAWLRSEVAGVELTHSNIPQNRQGPPTWQVTLHLRGGQEVGLLPGRPEPELRWAARTLSDALKRFPRTQAGDLEAWASDRPADNRVVLDQSIQGLTITLPAPGVWTVGSLWSLAGPIFLGAAVIWCGAVGWWPGLEPMVRTGQLLASGALGLLGLFLVGRILTRARRVSVLVLDDDWFTWRQGDWFGETIHRYRRSTITGVGVDAAGGLLLRFRSGNQKIWKTHYPTDRGEVPWLAALLRHVLNVPWAEEQSLTRGLRGDLETLLAEQSAGSRIVVETGSPDSTLLLPPPGLTLMATGVATLGLVLVAAAASWGLLLAQHPGPWWGGRWGQPVLVTALGLLGVVVLLEVAQVCWWRWDRITVTSSTLNWRRRGWVGVTLSEYRRKEILSVGVDCCTASGNPTWLLPEVSVRVQGRPPQRFALWHPAEEVRWVAGVLRGLLDVRWADDR